MPWPVFCLITGFPCTGRLLAAFLDFLPFCIVMVYYVSPDASGEMTRELYYLREVGVMFLAWTLPRTLFALVFRSSFSQMLLGGEIRSCVDGSRGSAVRAGLRNLLGVLDAVPGFVFVNLALVFLRRDRRTLYDLVAGTVMVDVERRPPENWRSQVDGGYFRC